MPRPAVAAELWPPETQWLHEGWHPGPEESRARETEPKFSARSEPVPQPPGLGSQRKPRHRLEELDPVDQPGESRHAPARPGQAPAPNRLLVVEPLRAVEPQTPKSPGQRAVRPVDPVRDARRRNGERPGCEFPPVPAPSFAPRRAGRRPPVARPPTEGSQASMQRGPTRTLPPPSPAPGAKQAWENRLLAGCWEGQDVGQDVRPPTRNPGRLRAQSSRRAGRKCAASPQPDSRGRLGRARVRAATEARAATQALGRAVLFASPTERRGEP